MNFSRPLFEYNEFRSIWWGSMDGRRRHVYELEDSHIVNILNWIHDRPELYNPELYGMFEVEAKLRNFAAKHNGTPLLSKKEDGYWVYGNEN